VQQQKSGISTGRCPYFLIQFLDSSLFEGKNPLVVLIESLGRRLQFILPSEYVPVPLGTFLGERFCRAKVLDKTWGIDDLPQTRRVALDAGPDRCELVLSGAPATGSEAAFVSWLNYDGFVSLSDGLSRMPYPF
jgi:hypothetical protein